MSRHLKSTFLALCALAFTLSIAGCSGGEEPLNPCEGLTCGAGRCIDDAGRAACECDSGYHAEGLTCVKDNEPPKNPCEPNPCIQPNRGVCHNVSGQAVCECNPGTQEGPGGACIIPSPCEPNPCTQPNKTDCSVSNGQAVCACVSGYVPDGEACKPEQTVSCTGQHSEGDAFEPDECPALARAVGASGTLNEEHTLSPVGDEDWLKLTAVAGHVYEAVATGAAGARLNLDVYAADGTTVLASDHRGQAVAKLVHKAAASGVLFFRIRAFVSGETGAYTLSIVDLGEDDFADEPSLATRLNVSSGTPVSGALQFEGDRDVVKLPLTAGHSYRFEAAWSATSTDSLRLELIAPDQTTVVVSSQQVAPRALTRITITGDYFLRLQEPTGSLRAGYTFTVTDLGVDDHGDGPTESSPVIIDAPPADGGFEHPEDVDVFSFQAQAGHIYAFTCSPSGGTTACHVSLSDAAGNVLAVDNNGGTGYIVHEYAQAGTYYFRLSSEGVGSYTYRLEDLGFDDHGDTSGTATALTAPASGSGRLELPGDVDVFSFTGSADETYEFTCTGTSVDCNVLLVDSSGGTVASDTDTTANARIVYRLPQAGTWFLHVKSTPVGTGSYGYQLVSLGTDEHGDTPATATPVGVGAPEAGGRIDTPTDVDVFSFDALANHIYEITCTSTQLTCQLQLLNAAGAVLDSNSGTHAKVVYEVGAAGTYYFRLASASSTVGTYAYRVVDLGVDDHGDTRATATLITASTTSSTGRVETLGDVDYFSFAGAVNTTYEFSCSSSAIDCDVVLSDASGAVLLSDTGSSSEAKVTYVVRTAGTFFLKASSGTTTTGDYTYQLKNLGPDDHGNTLDNATAVTPSTTFSNGRIDSATDVDVFSFVAVAGHIYEVECTTTTIDCDLVLMDNTGTVIASDTGSGTTARVRLELNTAGTYYFRIQPGTTTFGNYSYRVRDLGLDDHGDAPATATLLVPMASAATGQIETSGDVDVFAFSATANRIYEFTCTGAAGDCDLELVNGTGDVLIRDNSSSSSAKVVYEFGTEGTYYLRLLFGNASTTVIGGYTYQLKDLGVDDHGDTLATATLITPSATASTGQLETLGDLDYFSFSASVNTTYEFSCSSSAIDCNVVLYDSNGTAVQSDTGSSSSAKVTYLVRAAGTFSVRVYSGTATLGAYTYQLKNLGTDDHGNTRSDATAVTPSSTSVNARIDASGDVDVFSFEAVAGHIYEVECIASAFDCDLVLMDAEGTVILSDTTNSTSASVLAELNTAGTYYFRIQPGSSFGAYAYRLRDLGMDDHGDRLATATPIAPSATSINARFEVSGDVDWFSFTAEAGHIYEFTCAAQYVNCNAYLYDAEGTLLLSDTATSNTARVRMEFTTGGTYYVATVATDWATYTTSHYTYRLVDLGVDDHGDTQATATPIVPSTTSTPALFEVSGDADWFSFTAEAGHVYEFICIASLIDCNAYLYDATGTVLRSDIASSSTARVRMEFTTGGTYYLRAVAADWYSTNGYTYQLRDLGVDDHGDTQATATPIVPSTTSTPALFEVSGDVDWFSFTAEAAHIYEFTCSPSSIDCNVYLYDATGTLLRSDTSTSNAASVRMEFTTGGTYYLRAVAADWSTTNGYTYQLRDLGVDDHGDTQATATPIVPSTTSTPALFEVSGDVDWFSFTAETGHIYEFICNAAFIDCNVYLYDATGTLLRSDTSTGKLASVRMEFNTGGTYYLRAVAADWGSTNGYTYRLVDVGVDDHGDTQATATPIAPSTSSTPAVFEAGGDVDWFSFTAEASHVYEFTCNAAFIDCNAYLYDAAGNLLRSDTASSSTARVRMRMTTGGTYYLRAVAADWFSTNGYTYQLRDLGVDDHGDTQATATPVVPSTTSTNASIEVTADQDWFSFTAAAGQTFDFFCTTSSFDCDLFLYNAAGTELASDTSSSTNAQLTRRFTAAGTYFVKVISGNSVLGPYAYRLNDRGVDEHSDTFTGATALTLGTATAGNIQIASDLDFFAVNLASSTGYTLTPTGIALTLTVYAPNQTTVLYTGAGPATFTSTAAGGTHYVRVQGAASGTGAYTVTVQ
ncbi:pre-peptidase C-terminal domain-containing protein [Hyalangium rubrum]|uniref:Pre-peptidase C-terminal domain-containing protein n=1 Tax=Hyalangium rubrum TaxID=3103134 RepID=A0ABU5H7R7_9BACT|nr:pre-peptidase C-terminal domain-containing protein [Hyalangium sp. s54d21]MDY7229149.1 pre-peptidase C-terminal domain-containing protein [Hyalangium sp. s54d21]